MATVLAPRSQVEAVRPGLLPTVLIGVFMTILDFFIVNVAIPATQRGLHAGPTAIQWVVAGYGLAFGSGLILGGRLGDVFGRRRMFAVGLVLFTLASVACGLAPSATALVAARIVQGAAAAVLAPQVLAIIRTAYSGAAQARAINAYTLTMGLAAVFGQLIGGVLIQAGLGWRACFLINVPIGAAALLMSARTIPESRVSGRDSRLDLGGTVLITLGLAATLLPLIEGRAQGWPPWVWLSFGAALVLFIAYGRRRHEAPLIDLTLFRERAFTAGLCASLTFMLGMPAYFLTLALYLQDGRGLSALESGLIFVPIGAGYLAASLLAPRVAARLGRQAIALGGLTRLAGLAVLLAAVAAGTSVGWLVPGLVVDGVGMGLALTPIVGTVLARIAPQHAGSAAGVLTTTQQVGGALGVAIIGIVFYPALAHGLTTAFEHGLCYLLVVVLAVTVPVQLLPAVRGRG